jgi:hypothetical protein
VSTGQDDLKGTIRWAVVPFAPSAPFRLYAGIKTTPMEVADPDQIIGGLRKGGDPEFTALVPVKARPILVLSEGPSARTNEIVALRLIRLSKLSNAEQATVRSQDDPLLFHLPPKRFALSEENAVMIDSLIRCDLTAISRKPALGRLNKNEMRVIGERIIRSNKFDTTVLFQEYVRRIASRRR